MHCHKVIILILILLITTPLYGQQVDSQFLNDNVRLNAGYVLSTTTFDGNTREALNSPHFLAGYKKGWKVGVDYKIYRYRGMDAYVGLQYIRKGFIQKRCHMRGWADECHGIGGDLQIYAFQGTTKLNYLSIPITLHRDFNLKMLTPFVRGGISADYLLNQDTTNIYSKYSLSGSDDLEYRSGISKDLVRVSPSFRVSAGTHLEKLLNVPLAVKITYSQNIFNIYNGSADFELRNRSFRFGIEVRL